jgi:hypothetical protein
MRGTFGLWIAPDQLSERAPANGKVRLERTTYERPLYLIGSCTVPAATYHHHQGGALLGQACVPISAAVIRL